MNTTVPRHGAGTRRIDVQLTEWSGAGPDSHPDLLRGVTLGEDPTSKSVVRQLAQHGVVEVTELRDGISIETSSYVGRIAVGPLQVSIFPKMAWHRWIGLFSYALRLRGLVRTEEVAARTSPTSLHDLIVLELLVETRDLIGRGLHREYVRRREDLAAPRGRIDFGKVARRGGIRGAAIPCRYTRRSDDFHLNRALLAGLRTAGALATDVHLRADVRRLAQQLDDTVAAVPLTAEVVAQAQGGLDRRTARYAPALRLIELLRRGVLVSIEQPISGPALALRGFALDMNELWQRLLGRVLREWLSEMELKEEHALNQLIRPDPAYAPRRRGGHIPRPDYAVFRGGRLVTYLDAKYRDIWEKGLPRDMLYQLALYASAHEGGTAAILYPTEHAEAAEERVRIHDPQDDSVRATVALRPVDLGELEGLIHAPLTTKLSAQRSHFAAALLE